MKIRSGFVSNSSSSSFIIRDGRTAVEVAKQMCEIVFEEYEREDWFSEEKKKEYLEKNKKILKWLDDNPKYPGSILIPLTCNYETWIYTDWIKLGNIFIDTCNNHDWEPLRPSKWTSDTDYEYKMKDDMKSKNIEFYDLNLHRVITRLEWEEEKRKYFDELLKKRQEEGGS